MAKKRNPWRKSAIRGEKNIIYIYLYMYIGLIQSNRFEAAFPLYNDDWIPIQGSKYHIDHFSNDCVGTVTSQCHYPLVSPLIPTPLYLHVEVQPISLKAACPVHHWLPIGSTNSRRTGHAPGDEIREAKNDHAEVGIRILHALILSKFLHLTIPKQRTQNRRTSVCILSV